MLILSPLSVLAEASPKSHGLLQRSRLRTSQLSLENQIVRNVMASRWRFDCHFNKTAPGVVRGRPRVHYQTCEFVPTNICQTVQFFRGWSEKNCRDTKTGSRDCRMGISPKEGSMVPSGWWRGSHIRNQVWLAVIPTGYIGIKRSKVGLMRECPLSCRLRNVCRRLCRWCTSQKKAARIK